MSLVGLSVRMLFSIEKIRAAETMCSDALIWRSQPMLLMIGNYISQSTIMMERFDAKQYQPNDNADCKSSSMSRWICSQNRSCTVFFSFRLFLSKFQYLGLTDTPKLLYFFLPSLQILTIRGCSPFARVFDL